MSSIRLVLMSGYQAALLVCLLVLSTSLISAQVMSSATYRIQTDSVNVGGGYGTSTSYTLETTAGEVSSGLSSSTNYQLRAGYQQMQEVFLSMTAIADVVMTPSLGGLTGGTSNGSTSFVVVTDSPSGYTLTLAAALSPAMQGNPAGTIANYVPAAGVPDFVFSTAAAQARFGFSPEGVNLVARYRDNGGACGVSSGDTALACWDGVSTTAQTIVTGTGSNHPSGATTTLRFRVGISSGASVTAGTYTATTTITALPL